MRGVIWQSLCFFLYCQYASSVDIPSEKLACITFAKYAEYDCTGTELGTEKYTTYSESGHSECKDVPDEKTGMTLFTTNNEYCDLSEVGPMLRQTWYLFDQQKDCTPFLRLKIFQLEQMFSADSCILGGKTKFVSCAAGSCDDSSLPDYTSGSETIDNDADGGNTTQENVTGNATLPPPPDTSFGTIKELCSEKYIEKNSESECLLVCEPGLCCFDDADSCENNLDGCALYHGCDNITTGNATRPPPPDTSFGTIKELCSEKYIEKNNESECLLVCEPGLCCFDDTDSCENNLDGCALYHGCDNVTTGNTKQDQLSQGNSVGEFSAENITGNSTGGNITGNTSEVPPPPNASLGEIKVLCSGKYIQEYNESDCLSICAPGGCCFTTETDSCSINSEACALYDGCEDILLNSTKSMGNETVMNATESVENETAPAESKNTTNGGIGDVGNTSNVTDLNATSPAHTGNASSLVGNGTATGANSRPPMPDNVRGGPEVVCSAEFRKENKNGICLNTCEPGACCFSEADSCSSNTEVCALYALCKPVLKASGRFLYFL